MDETDEKIDTGVPAEEGSAEPVEEEQGGKEENSLEKKVKNAESEIKKKSEEIAALKDLMQRRQADFENYKKRMIRMEEDNKKLAVKNIALDIITINDDLIRASEAAKAVSGDALVDAHASYVEGVMIISKGIESALEKYGIVEIDSLDVPFNPVFHEAVEIIMGDGVLEDTVTKVYQKGFKLEEYILRCAKVQVTKPLPKVSVEKADTEKAEDAQDEQE